MIAILLVTHGDIGESLRRAAERMIGTQPKVAVVTVRPEDGPPSVMEHVRASLASLGEGGCLVLVDIFGGTPSNVMARFAGPGISVVTGVSLPMLVTALSQRDRLALDPLAEKVADAGRRGVVSVNQAIKPGAGS